MCDPFESMRNGRTVQTLRLMSMLIWQRGKGQTAALYTSQGRTRGADTTPSVLLLLSQPAGGIMVGRVRLVGSFVRGVHCDVSK